jgi:hypothetical protein
MNTQRPAPGDHEAEVHGPIPTPVTPSDETERPDGVAFDLPRGTDTPGMPRGDQRAANEAQAQTVHETVNVPPGHLDLPGTESGATPTTRQDDDPTPTSPANSDNEG